MVTVIITNGAGWNVWPAGMEQRSVWVAYLLELGVMAQHVFFAPMLVSVRARRSWSSASPAHEGTPRRRCTVSRLCLQHVLEVQRDACCMPADEASTASIAGLLDALQVQQCGTVQLVVASNTIQCYTSLGRAWASLGTCNPSHKVTGLMVQHGSHRSTQTSAGAPVGAGLFSTRLCAAHTCDSAEKSRLLALVAKARPRSPTVHVFQLCVLAGGCLSLASPNHLRDLCQEGIGNGIGQVRRVITAMG